ncbi:Conserved exported protein of uncharacterised function [Mycobacterium tuberculosis]|nr:Conserved exported protein of uncharacterised function [Mycobacterium tuberculosis]
MVRRALRLAAGTASLAAGTWLLRALHGTPAALGADAASIRAVSEQSPNYRDGAFVNLDPASMFTLDREELRLIVWELVARHSASRPAAPIPLASPNIYRGDASRLAVSWFGTRRRCWKSTATGCLPIRCGAIGAHRPTSSAPSACIRRRCNWQLSRPSTPWSSATTTTTISISTPWLRWSACNGPRSLCRSGSAPTFGRGVFRRIALLSSTGTRALRSMSSPWSACRHGTSRDGS